MRRAGSGDSKEDQKKIMELGKSTGEVKAKKRKYRIVEGKDR